MSELQTREVHKPRQGSLSRLGNWNLVRIDDQRPQHVLDVLLRTIQAQSPVRVTGPLYAINSQKPMIKHQRSKAKEHYITKVPKVVKAHIHLLFVLSSRPPKLLCQLPRSLVIGERRLPEVQSRGCAMDPCAVFVVRERHEVPKHRRQ